MKKLLARFLITLGLIFSVVLLGQHVATGTNSFEALLSFLGWFIAFWWAV